VELELQEIPFDRQRPTGVDYRDTLWGRDDWIYLWVIGCLSS